MKFQLESGNRAVTESHRRLHKLDAGYWAGYFWWVINIKNGVNAADGVKSFRHDGGAKGTRNVFIIYPEYQMGISVITNVIGPDVFSDLTLVAKGLYEGIR